MCTSMDHSCGICGSNHETNSCTVIEIKNHIYDTVVPSKALLSLPDSLEVEKMADGTTAVTTKRLILKGTRFGPFIAKRALNLSPSITFPIKIFVDDSEDFAQYYLDTTDENECNWMMFVSAAETAEEQNLVCYQDDRDVYYLSSRDIKCGEHLKVWYSSSYAERIKAKLLPFKNTLEYEKRLDSLALSKLITKQQNIMQRDNWSCKFCGIVESNVVNFSTHILEHYILQLRKVCEICREAFATRKGLKKHVKIVHCSSLSNPPEQTSKAHPQVDDLVVERTKRKDAVIGGPLLNDVLSDSLDNSMEINSFDLENQNILIESDNLNVDNILNENVKELEHFNFELDETEEKFVCDVCLKSFNKLKLLVQHLKKHTAKYFCHKCLKVFCRSENLKSHICNNPMRLECSFCKRLFTQKKYLRHHIEVKHSGKYSCGSCTKTFSSNKEKNEHNCGVETEQQTYPCITCGKVFHQECYLKKHVKLHTKQKIKKFVCEVCGKKFHERRILRQHALTHLKRTFGCQICGKKFVRLEVLNNHLMTHTSVKQFKCEECGKTFKVKKNLKIHMQLHNENQTYRCTECPKVFNSKANMQKHHKTMHNKTCSVCNKRFTSPELRDAHAVEHLSSYYVCQFCNKVVKLRSSLVRHLKTQHKEDAGSIDLSKLKAVTKKEEVESGTVNFGDLEVDLPTSFVIQQNDGQDVCLLSNIDQGLALDSNSFYCKIEIAP